MCDKAQQSLRDFSPQNPEMLVSKARLEPAQRGFSWLAGFTTTRCPDFIWRHLACPLEGWLQVPIKCTNLNCEDGAEHSVASKMQNYPPTRPELFPEGCGGGVPSEFWESPNQQLRGHYYLESLQTTRLNIEEKRQEESKESCFSYYFL